MTPQVLFGQVMHQRLFPRRNGFRYGIYYLCLPLSRLEELDDGWRFGLDGGGVMGFSRRDHGPLDGGSLRDWAQALLARHGISAAGEIMLVAMPRVFGHVFNPVSFWLCHDAQGRLAAVICEVNNTFGERHCYVCHAAEGGDIAQGAEVVAEKAFHVSPFLPREGRYRFRFEVSPQRFAVRIDYDAADGRPQLLTSLAGRLEPWSRTTLRRAFWRYPAVAGVALWRIHLHALRLWLKGVAYIPKPAQSEDRETAARQIKKM